MEIANGNPASFREAEVYRNSDSNDGFEGLGGWCCVTTDSGGASVYMATRSQDCLASTISLVVKQASSRKRGEWDLQLGAYGTSGLVLVRTRNHGDSLVIEQQQH